MYVKKYFDFMLMLVNVPICKPSSSSSSSFSITLFAVKCKTIFDMSRHYVSVLSRAVCSGMFPPVSGLLDLYVSNVELQNVIRGSSGRKNNHVVLRVTCVS